MVEDSEDDALLVLRALRQGGFDPQAHRVDTEQAFLSALGEPIWDLVLSDYSMPHFNGLRAFELYKQSGLNTPFMFVSGRIGEERAVEAMRRGVSDYVPKDNLNRLAAAVDRELRDSIVRRQRQEMEAALLFSEERLRRLAQNAPDIIYEYMWEPNPHFAYVSPAARDITGYTPEEHYTDAELWLRIAEEEHRDTLRSLLQPQDEPHHDGAVMRWQHRDGRHRWVEQRTAVVRDEHGRLMGIEGIVRDITERKALEEQLLASQRMEAIGRLAGGIAHDFNNMLTVIGGYCSLLRRKVADQEACLRDVAKIENATDRSASLVSQLLAFSRRQPRNLLLLDFNTTLGQFEPMLRRLIGEDVQVEIRYGEGLPPVRADRSQIEQVVMNLAVNARDAMPQGGRLTIETDLAEVNDLVTVQPLALVAGPYVRLTVSDSGTGMSDDVKARIFDPFFTTKDVGKGTGLGLSTVYGIVKQMDGDIWVYSEPDIGTTFKIYLPSSQGMPQDEQPVAPSSEPTGHGTILLVEDESLVREAAAEILGAHGYAILSASNGQDALNVIANCERQIDLLLTDLVMPKMNGVELAQRVRELLPDIRVLYTTGYTEASLPGQCSPEGMTDMLPKPFGSKALLQKVHDMLSQGTASRR